MRQWPLEMRLRPLLRCGVVQGRRWESKRAGLSLTERLLEVMTT